MKISSAAMTQFHLNESPDFRIQDVCLKKGIDISNYRAKQIKQIDWITYDYIVALDPNIYDVLQGMKPVDSKTSSFFLMLQMELLILIMAEKLHL